MSKPPKYSYGIPHPSLPKNPSTRPNTSSSGHPSMGCGAASPQAPVPSPPIERRNNERTPCYPPAQGYEAIETGLPVPIIKCPHQRASARREKYLIVFAIMLFILGYVIQTPVDSLRRKITRAAWAQEKKVYEAERRKKEEIDRQEREEMERKRRGIEWQELKAGKCTRYGVREYTSVLGNVPLGVNAVDECWAKSTLIHDRNLLPSQCEDKGYCGKVIGHWGVDFMEPECTATWGQIVDKGCDGMLRRYDGELLHLSEVDNWKAICSTMPNATYRPGVVLGPGAFCSECHGNHCGSGYWATWHVVDGRCE